MSATPDAVSRKDVRHQARVAAVVFLVRDGSVLLERRPATSDRFAGLWDGVGGHVEAGEDVEAAARREVREETGLEATALRLRGVIHETGLCGHAYLVFLFVGEADSAPVRRGDGVGELAWHALDGLSRLPLVPDVGVLLPRLLEAREPLFVTERYDGGDVPLALAIGGEEVALPGAGPSS